MTKADLDKTIHHLRFENLKMRLELEQLTHNPDSGASKKIVAKYMRLKHPTILYHFDSSGLHHTKTQAGQLKAIQHSRGFPDLFIAHVKTEENEWGERKTYHGLFIEVKKEGTKLYKLNGEFINDHLKDQGDCLLKLERAGYAIAFGIGLDQCLGIIDSYLK